MDGLVPFYPLYALLFAHTGLSDADISVLFVIWSLTGLVAEVPLGALADRFSRRSALQAAGAAKAACYLLWTVLPDFPAFAVGFVLWGIGGAFSSGALEALVYDGLADGYARVLGRIRAAEMLAQLPTAALATALFAVGGFGLVGWVSVATSLVAGVLAGFLPEPPREADDDYWATLRAGLAEARTNVTLRSVVVAVALLGGLDAIEEYFSLMAGHWGVAVTVIPVALLGIPLAGAVGATLGGRHHRFRSAVLGCWMACAAIILGVAGIVHQPVGLVGVAVFYLLYRFVLLVADARLQESITTSARATVTSVAELGTEVTCFLVYGAWAVGDVAGVAVLCLVIAVVLLYCLRSRR